MMDSKQLVKNYVIDESSFLKNFGYTNRTATEDNYFTKIYYYTDRIGITILIEWKETDIFCQVFELHKNKKIKFKENCIVSDILLQKFLEVKSLSYCTSANDEIISLEKTTKGENRTPLFMMKLFDLYAVLLSSCADQILNLSTN